MRKMVKNRSISASLASLQFIPAPTSDVRLVLFKNEGDSGDVDENKGRGKTSVRFWGSVPSDQQGRSHRGPWFFRKWAEISKDTAGKDSKRALANSPYDGITREVIENKGTATSEIRKMVKNRSISASLASSQFIPAPTSDVRLPLFKNEGDSGDMYESTGTPFASYRIFTSWWALAARQ